MSLNIVLKIFFAVTLCATTSLGQVFSLTSDPVSFEGQGEIAWKLIPKNSLIENHLEGVNWQASTRSPNIGPGDELVVYRMAVRNDLGRPSKFAFVSMDGQVADEVYLVVQRGDGRREWSKTGQMVERDQWPVQGRNLILPFSLAKDEQVTVFFAVRSLYSRNLLYQIMSDDKWLNHDLRSSILVAFYFGVIVSVLAINIYIWAVSKSVIAVAYIAMCVMTLLASGVGLGFANLILSPVWVVRASLVESVIVPLTLVTIGWFGREYLETRKWAPITWWWYTVTMFVGAGAAMLVSLNTRLMEVTQLNQLLISVTTVVGIVTAIVGIYKKSTPYAWSYLFGVGAYMIGGLIWNKQFSMEIASTPARVYALFVAQIFQNIVFMTTFIRQESRRSVDSVRVKEKARSGERMGNLVRVLTHDLANYMSIIDAGANMLSRERIDDQARVSWAQKIKKSIDHQKEVLESIKQMKAIEDGKATFALEPVLIDPLIEELFATFEAKLSFKGVRLLYRHEGADGAAVMAERRTLFHSVLSNLVSNAIKFSEPLSEILITVMVTESEVSLKITDHGIGIPKGLLDKLFFTDAVTSRAGTAGEMGTGFGLPICRTFMDYYGGSISVESVTKEQNSQKHGTTFELRFKKA